MGTASWRMNQRNGLVNSMLGSAAQAGRAVFLWWNFFSDRAIFPVGGAARWRMVKFPEPF